MNHYEFESLPSPPFLDLDYSIVILVSNDVVGHVRVFLDTLGEVLCLLVGEVEFSVFEDTCELITT